MLGLRHGGWVARQSTAPPENKQPTAGACDRRIGLIIVRDFPFLGRFFDFHVTELFRVKNLATFQALDVFGVVVPGNNSNFRMLTNGRHRSREHRNLPLFPQDCSELFGNLKRVFVESFSPEELFEGVPNRDRLP